MVGGAEFALAVDACLARRRGIRRSAADRPGLGSPHPARSTRGGREHDLGRLAAARAVNGIPPARRTPTRKDTTKTISQITARIALVLTLTATAGLPGSARAESRAVEPVEGVTSAASLPAAVAPSETGLRYALPWQLRPVTLGDLARVDSVAAVFT